MNFTKVARRLLMQRESTIVSDMIRAQCSGQGLDEQESMAVT